MDDTSQGAPATPIATKETLPLINKQRRRTFWMGYRYMGNHPRTNRNYSKVVLFFLFSQVLVVVLEEMVVAQGPTTAYYSHWEALPGEIPTQ